MLRLHGGQSAVGARGFEAAARIGTLDLRIYFEFEVIPF